MTGAAGVEEYEDDDHSENHDPAKQKRKKAKLFLMVCKFALVSHGAEIVGGYYGEFPKTAKLFFNSANSLPAWER